MNSPIGDQRARSTEVASALGHHWVGVEHLVLALLHPDGDSVARQALLACGVSYEALFSRVSELPEHYTSRPEIPSSPGGGAFVSPEGLAFLARAEGLAAGLGFDEILPEHWLLSLLWDGSSSVAWSIIEDLGATRAQILDALVSLGVKVPMVPIRERRAWTEFRVVSPAEFERVRQRSRRAEVQYRVAYRGDEILLSVADPPR